MILDRFLKNFRSLGPWLGRLEVEVVSTPFEKGKGVLKGRLRKATELRTATPTVYASRVAKGERR